MTRPATLARIFIPVLLTIALLPTTATSAEVRKVKTLSALEVVDSRGQSVQIGTHAEILIPSDLEAPFTNDRVPVQFEGRWVFVDRHELIHSVEADGNLLADVLEDSINLQADPAQCPLGTNGRLKPGVKWNFTTAKLLIQNCAPRAVSVVGRTWSGSFNTNCRPPAKQDHSAGRPWISCAPPPVCTPTQIEQKRKGAEERRQAWKQKCSGKNVTIPEDKDPSCGIPLVRPTALVIHQTEGRMTDGPEAMQEFHLDRGWDDVGYNFVLSQTSSGWKAFEGRPQGFEGSHAGSGLNRGAIGIAVSGNFNPKAHPGKPSSEILPPPEALLLLKSLVRKLKTEHPTLVTIDGHGEFKRKGMGCDTDCPSPSLQHFVNTTRTRGL